MLPPNNVPLGQLAKEEGISQATLHKWWAGARDKGSFCLTPTQAPRAGPRAASSRRLHHPPQRHIIALSPVQHRLDNARVKQSEAQDAGQVGRRDPLAHAQFGDGGELARLQHPFPAEGRG